MVERHAIREKRL
jgi:hypothetical protein